MDAQTLSDFVKVIKKQKPLNKADAFDLKIMTESYNQVAVLIENLADVIMKNKYLSAEIASRWVEKHGYYFTPKAEADAKIKQALKFEKEMARKYPNLARKRNRTARQAKAA